MVVSAAGTKMLPRGRALGLIVMNVVVLDVEADELVALVLLVFSDGGAEIDGADSSLNHCNDDRVDDLGTVEELFELAVI
jgi:hypothetical protein